MNRTSTRETDADCNICGESVEIVDNAASRCSNRRCVTRDRDNNLSTDATAQEVAEYYQSRDVVKTSEIDRNLKQEYKQFKRSNDHKTATKKNGAIKALLEFSSYVGFGELRMEVDNE